MRAQYTTTASSVTDAARLVWARRSRRLRHSRERVCGIAMADDTDDEPVADLEYPGGPHLGGNVGAPRYAAHSSDDRELVAAVAEGFDLIVGEFLPLGEEAPQPSTYSGAAIPDLALDPRLGGGPLDIGVEQREKIIEPVGTVGVEEVPAQLSIGDGLVLRRVHAAATVHPSRPGVQRSAGP